MQTRLAHLIIVKTETIDDDDDDDINLNRNSSAVNLNDKFVIKHQQCQQLINNFNKIVEQNDLNNNCKRLETNGCRLKESIEQRM